MGGDYSTCGTVGVYVESAAAFLGSEVEAMDDVVTIDSGPLIDPRTGDAYGDLTSDEQGLIRAAWLLLYKNTDLVKWAVCCATGRASAGDCIVHRIQGKGKNVKIYLVNEDGAADARFATAPHPIISRRIDIPRLGDTWNSMCAMWGDGTDGEKVCVAITLAAILAHELGHICWRSLRDGDAEKGECFTTYLIQGVLHYALCQKYPESQGHKCCADVAADAFGVGSYDQMPLQKCQEEIA